MTVSVVPLVPEGKSKEYLISEEWAVGQEASTNAKVKGKRDHVEVIFIAMAVSTLSDKLAEEWGNYNSRKTCFDQKNFNYNREFQLETKANALVVKRSFFDDDREKRRYFLHTLKHRVRKLFQREKIL